MNSYKNWILPETVDRSLYSFGMRHPTAGKAVVAGCAGIALLTVGYALNRVHAALYAGDGFADRLAAAPSSQGVWDTDVPLDRAIRQELPGSLDAKMENPELTQQTIDTYREDFLNRNPNIRAILELQEAGAALPPAIGISYVELDNVPGFGR